MVLDLCFNLSANSPPMSTSAFSCYPFAYAIECDRFLDSLLVSDGILAMTWFLDTASAGSSGSAYFSTVIWASFFVTVNCTSFSPFSISVSPTSPIFFFSLPILSDSLSALASSIRKSHLRISSLRSDLCLLQLKAASSMSLSNSSSSWASLSCSSSASISGSYLRSSWAKSSKFWKSSFRF